MADPAIPDEALSPVEQAARDWRREVVEDLGGPEAVPAATLALLNAATGSKIILDSLDRYIFELAESGGLVSRRTRKAFAVVADRMRVADSLTRQLQALGLERRSRPAPSLQDYLRARYGQGQEPEDGDRHGDQEPTPEAEDPAASDSPGSPQREVATPSEIARPGGAEEPPEAEGR